MSGETVFIGNIEDRVMGGLIQVTLETYQANESVDAELEYHCRVHGTLLGPKHEFTLRTIAMYLAWQDSFAGLEDLDQYLFQTEVMPPLEAMVDKAKAENKAKGVS